MEDVKVSDSDISWGSANTNYERKIKNDLQVESELRYMSLVEKIVDRSDSQLQTQNRSKRDMRKSFQTFFIGLLSFQMLILVFFLVLSSASKDFNLSDNVIITFITSVFVETLGAIGIMIKFAFDSEQEVKILEILNGAITNFQKFPNDSKKSSDSKKTTGHNHKIVFCPKVFK